MQQEELGVWEFRSKSKQNICSLEGTCRGYMFALKVTDQLESWPEHGTHHRRWVCNQMPPTLISLSVQAKWLTCHLLNFLSLGQVGVNEAHKLCRYEWMRDALNAFRLRLQSTKPAVTLPAISEPLLPFRSLKPEIEMMDNSAIALCWEGKGHLQHDYILRRLSETIWLFPVRISQLLVYENWATIERSRSFWENFSASN